MDQVILLLVCMSLWALELNLLYIICNYNRKIARNLVSATHAILVILCYTLNVTAKNMFYVSYGYYLMDLCIELHYLLFHNNKITSSLALIIHHIISCYILCYLNGNYVPKYLYYSFFIIELSNIPIYIVYHLRRIKYNNKTILKCLLYLEAVSFIFFRLILCGINIHNSYKYIPNDVLISALSIYLISIIWTYALFVQIYN